MTNLKNIVAIFALIIIETSSINAQNKTHVLFLGASITKGYKLEESETFPRVFKQLLEKQKILIHLTNNAVNGAASIDGISQFKLSLTDNTTIDYLFITLGLSDVIYNVPTDQIKNNLNHLINIARKHNPEIYIYLFQGKIFQRHKTSIVAKSGSRYEQSYERIFKELALEKKIQLLPFILEPIKGNWKYFQKDQLHPNKKGMKEIAKMLVETVKDKFK